MSGGARAGSWRDRLGTWLPGRGGRPAAPAKAGAPNPGRQPAPRPAAGPAAPGGARKVAAGGGGDGAGGGVVVVTVLGLGGEALERVLDIAAGQCAARGAKPVFVTDASEFGPFRRRRLVADQVVDAEARLASTPDLAWRLYRRRQYALLAVRWRPRVVISFGRRPDEDCLRALNGSGPGG